jgi:hypothetical protein
MTWRPHQPHHDEAAPRPADKQQTNTSNKQSQATWRRHVRISKGGTPHGSAYCPPRFPSSRDVTVRGSGSYRSASAR